MINFSILFSLQCSEALIRTMADLVVEKGFKELGYEYVNIDDCWLAQERDPSGKLIPDPKRFPNGMKSLADYVRIPIYHSFGKTFSFDQCFTLMIH